MATVATDFFSDFAKHEFSYSISSNMIPIKIGELERGMGEKLSFQRRTENVSPRNLENRRQLEFSLICI
jgi:hypothetical protein